MVPAIKVYKMDYSFIIKNYLNPALWQKTWTLFEYKDFVFTIRISSINTISNQINFELKLKDNSEQCTYDVDTNNISYSLKNGKIEFLIKSINGTILRSISFHEKYHVFTTLDAYKNAEKQGETEIETLRSIANDFLDGEEITNDEIRSAYIESYVENNKKNDQHIADLRSAYEYHLLTDLYLVFLKSIDDIETYTDVLNHLEDNEIENVLNEINEYKEYIETDEYMEEMHNLLEEI